MNILGIDTDAKGYISLLSDRNTIIRKIPTREVKIKRNGKNITSVRVNTIELYNLLKNLYAEYGLYIIALEKQQPSSFISSSALFTFAYNYGSIETAATLYNKITSVKDIQYVRPQEWKKYFNIRKKDKNASVPVAQDLINSGKISPLENGKRLTISASDAILIAYYWKLMNTPI